MEVLITTFRAVLILGALSGALALALVIADRYIANFGECTIRINEEKDLTVRGGGNLLDALFEKEIFVPSACGGKGTCGYCKVRVNSGGGPILPTEEPFLSEEERAQDVRLSCCVRVRNDLEIEVPKEILTIREYATRVEHLRDLTYDIKEIRLALVEPATIDFEPGQYVQFKVPPYGRSLEPVYRAYSIASPPSQNDALEFVVRLVPGGICTTYVFEHLREGDSLMINGPYGDFVSQDTDAEIIFIAGATGIAPIKSMLMAMAEQGCTRKTTLYFGCVQKRDMFYVDAMRELERRLPHFTFVPVLATKAENEQWDGETGLVTEVVDRNLEKGTDAEAYLCGSPGMVEAAAKLLREKGMGDEKIFFDVFE